MPEATKWRPKIRVIADRLVEEYGTPSLGNFRDPVKEIFYIVLSAKTTEQLYRVAHQRLWTRFRTIEAISKAPLRQIRTCVAFAGLGNKRSSHVKQIATRLYADFGSHPGNRLRALPPSDAYRYLRSLPGVGPKSALCVMMYSLDFDVFPVDAHVRRVLQRVGLSPGALSHYEAQDQFPSYAPKGLSKRLHVALVLHGRRVCTPRAPDCINCLIARLCKTGRKVASLKPLK
jgi:endonuclease III